MSQSCQDLMRQVQSSRVKYVYAALKEIRKSSIKTSKGVEMMVAAGLVHRLLQLVRNRDSLEAAYRSKVMELCISILGNMCMNEVTRKEVLKLGGILVIAELLELSQKESLQNRSSRCLANILISTSSWEPVHSTSAVETVTKFLRNTKNDEAKQTYIRAIRLLGQTAHYVKKLLEHNAVGTVLKHLDCDNEAVNQSALRCVHSLSVHRCTSQFASQVASSGKISYLLSLAKECSESAFHFIVKLSDHHNFRPEFGNAGGIKIFLDMFKSNDGCYDNWKSDLLSCLCLCCKDAVNRVKLREENVLVVLLECLSERKYGMLHLRLVTALVCFLYDQSSFDVLLENGLVKRLVKLLQDYMSRGGSLSGILIESGEDDSGKNDGGSQNDGQTCEILDGTETEGTKDGSDDTQDKDVTRETDDDQNVMVEKGGVAREQKADSETMMMEKHSEYTKSQKTDSKEVGLMNESEKSDRHFSDATTIKSETENTLELGNEIQSATEEENANQNSVKEEDTLSDAFEKGTIEKTSDVQAEVSAEPEDTEKQETVENFPSAGRPVYSMDSPTYDSVIDTSDYNEGAKCIESFSPGYQDNFDRLVSYSPFSTISYYSPSKSSSEVSPGYYFQSLSPAAADDIRLNAYPGPSNSSYHEDPLSQFSPSRAKHKYTGISCQIYNTTQSPASSPEQGTRSMTSCVSPGRRWSFSSDDSSFMNSDVGSLSGDQRRNERDTAQKAFEYSPVSSPLLDSAVGDANEENDEPVEPAKEIDEERVYKDESKNPGSSIDTADKIVTKVGKRKNVHGTCNVLENNILILLSRVSQMTDPTQYLVTMETMTALLRYICVMEAPLARCARLLSRVFRNPMCFDKLLGMNMPLIIYTKMLEGEDVKAILATRKSSKQNSLTMYSPDKSRDMSSDSDRFSMTDDDDENPSKRRRTSVDQTRNRPSTQKLKGVYHTQEEEVAQVGKCGIAFLEDLGGVADTQFGQGTVDRLFHTMAGSQHLDICISLLFIVWSVGSRQFYFGRREVFDSVLEVLRENGKQHKTYFTQILQALSFSAKIMDVKKRYQAANLGRQSSSSVRQRTSQPHFESVDHMTGSRLRVQKGHTYNNVEIKSSRLECFQMDKGLKTDIVFIVKDGKVPANKALLVKQSEVFTAMLIGQYMEAGKSEITVPETSEFAFSYIVHYLHGCDKYCCSVMKSLFCDPVTKATAEKCIQVLIEADKFFLHRLKAEMEECLFSRHVIPDSALMILEYGTIHDVERLQNVAVSCVLVDSENMKELVHHCQQILSSLYRDVFLNVLISIFIE